MLQHLAAMGSMHRIVLKAASDNGTSQAADDSPWLSRLLDAPYQELLLIQPAKNYSGLCL